MSSEELTHAEALIDLGRRLCGMNAELLVYNCTGKSITELDAMRLAVRLYNAPAEYKRDAIAHRYQMNRLVIDLEM